MQPVLNTSSFIFLIAVVLCLVVGSVLLVFSWNKSVSNRWLSGYFLLIGYAWLVAFLLYSRLITGSPWYHTYRTGYIPGLLLMPFSFFYIRSLVQQKQFRPADLIHFLPVIVFIIDFIPFYLKPGAYKLQQAAIDAQQLDTTWSQFSQGWLGIGFIYSPLRILLTTIYWAWQVRMIFRIKKLQGGNHFLAENRHVMLWTKIFCGSQVLFFLPYYMNVIFGAPENFFFVSITCTAIGICITIAALIMQPGILYGLKGIVIRNVENYSGSNEAVAPVNTAEKVMVEELGTQLVTGEAQSYDDKPNAGVYLAQEKLASLGEQISQHILQEHSFLKKGYTCAAMAAEMNLQPYILSGVINRVFKTNFNDFLNGYRVEYAKTLIEKGEGKLLTLEALSERCGFNNRNSFTTAFKKQTGSTPSAYIKATVS